MVTDFLKTKNIFLQQSSEDSWEEYEKTLKKKDYVRWDYVVLTASNEAQALAYRLQIETRLNTGRLSRSTEYIVLPDPDGLRVGSGGATFNVLRFLSENGVDDFCKKKILVIHSGGDSKRIPQYSACGKLFSPVPRVLPNKEPSTLFDEFIISTSGIPSRMQGGMLVLSGDVLLLFNPLQVDLQFGDAVAISIKENVETGKNHGVFLRNDKGNVERFLHKMPESELKAFGAVNENGEVDIDTGAVMLSGKILNDLYSLVCSEDGFRSFVNEKARISFYGDFLYPLAEKSSLEEYLKEKPEGEFCRELEVCRKTIWEKLNKYNLKILNLSPAEFVHFGTTCELIKLLNSDIDAYAHLGWSRHVCSNAESDKYSSNNSVIDESAQIGDGSYIENSVIGKNVKIGKGSIVSGVELENATVPEACVLHGLVLDDGRIIVRIYGVNDNPKMNVFMGKRMENASSLWEEKLYKAEKTMKEAVLNAISLLEKGVVTDKTGRMSLCESFNHADMERILEKERILKDRARAMCLLNIVKEKRTLDDAQSIFGKKIEETQLSYIDEIASEADVFEKMRLYYFASKLCESEYEDNYYQKAFRTICNAINEASELEEESDYSFVKESVIVNLPVRVNWGGGWSDTPPYCNENGGTVLNASVTLKGNYPIEVCARKLDSCKIIFESADAGAYREFESLNELQDYFNPFDPFALHKAALLSLGIIPKEGSDMSTVCKKLGGGLYLSTRVIDIPRGSGLGTSSILGCACIEALLEIFGKEYKYSDKIESVLKMEQLMSTGGGWQDQAGGLIKGIKLLKSKSGIKQKIEVEKVDISKETLKELEERFVLIYTGQRRLARNLLREVMGRYISSNKEALEVIYRIQRIAVLMKFELEKGNIDEFAKLLTKHWELSKKLDKGCTNTCIEQIFDSCEDLIDGKMICGAGGGGFLQAVLKKGVTKEQLHQRLKSVFNESGIDVWQCSFDLAERK